jgi:haloalkane dehalogenase
VFGRCRAVGDELGRLVAADMIGMGGSDKFSPSGPDRYHYAEQRD